MPTLLGPFNIGYPVLFRSGGDTVTEAFGKHIQEIERIYGILNTLDSGKLTTPDMVAYLNEHNTNANAHRNLLLPFTNITGNLDGARVSNVLSYATVPAGNVTGKLTNSTIDAKKVNGLLDFLSEEYGNGDQADKGDGITNSDLSQNGYVKFNNGLIINWGVLVPGIVSSENSTIHQVNFAKSFSSQCFVVVSNVSVYMNPNTNFFRINSKDIPSVSDVARIYYIALGI